MGRPLRLQFPGAVYHVTARGNRRTNIFVDERDHDVWLGMLEEATKRFRIVVHGYCLMGNHYHMMVETPLANLSAAMHYLNGTYAKYFNRRYGLTGHLFQGRFHSVLAERDEQVLELARYIVLNPVRAELVAHPGDWRWSSYRAMSGASVPPLWLHTAWVLEQFGGIRDRSIAAYIRFVDAGIGLPPPGKPRRRPPLDRSAVPALGEIERSHASRNAGIVAAHATAAYSREQIARHFAVSARTVTRITKAGRPD